MNTELIIKSLENAENDNRKFALLLILSELIKSNKLSELKNSVHLNERLFKSIGANFLARLVSTSQKVDPTASPLLYKSLSMSILAQFLDYPNLITDPVLLSKITTIADILTIEPQTNNDDFNNIRKHLLLDTFKYLFTLSQHCAEFLCSNADLPNILINQVILNQNFTLNTNYFTNKNFTNLNHSSPDDDENLLFIACKLLSSICSHFTSANSATYFNDKFIEYLKNFLNATNNHQGEFKFCLINCLNYFLEDEKIRKFFLTENLNAVDLTFSIISDLFKSKINQSFKELAFVLLKNSQSLFDFEFVYMKNKKLFYLIIHLLCIEIEFNLANRSLKSEIFASLTDKMSVYYTLLEEVIIILSTAAPFDDQNEEEAFEPELKKVIKVIVEALEAVILFVKDYLNDLDKVERSERILLVASIRVLICWMSHESVLEQELLDLMPRMMKFGEVYNEESINLFRFLVPGLQRVLIDKQERLEFLNGKNEKVRDQVKFEFEKSELVEQLVNIENMLEVCYKHTD